MADFALQPVKRNARLCMYPHWLCMANIREDFECRFVPCADPSGRVCYNLALLANAAMREDRERLVHNDMLSIVFCAEYPRFCSLHCAPCASFMRAKRSSCRMAKTC